jgi:hypothetical protein
MRNPFERLKTIGGVGGMVEGVKVKVEVERVEQPAPSCHFDGRRNPEGLKESGLNLRRGRNRVRGLLPANHQSQKTKANGQYQKTNVPNLTFHGYASS